MTPQSKPGRTTLNTLKTLIRVTRALRDTPETDTPPDSSSGGLRDAARRATEGLRSDPRVQGAAGAVQELRAQAGEQADQRLARLIQEKRARRGVTPDTDEVSALLERRRQERDAKLERQRARAELLARAETPDQRRILNVIADATPWAGGDAPAVRYTQLLDHLAPGGAATAEMAVHRALWTLAERRVLAVSPHGVITAVRTVPAAQSALPDA